MIGSREFPKSSIFSSRIKIESLDLGLTDAKLKRVDEGSLVKSDIIDRIL